MQLYIDAAGDGESVRAVADEKDLPSGAIRPEVTPAAAAASAVDLVYDGTAIRHRDEIDTWHVDAVGCRHASPGDGRQALACTWDEPLVSEGGLWRVETVAERALPLAIAAVQTHIDATARARGYGDGALLASYHASTIPSWAAEATAFVAWRDEVWVAAYQINADVAAGLRPLPTVAEVLAELPPIVWPANE